MLCIILPWLPLFIVGPGTSITNTQTSVGTHLAPHSQNHQKKMDHTSNYDCSPLFVQYLSPENYIEETKYQQTFHDWHGTVDCIEKCSTSFYPIKFILHKYLCIFYVKFLFTISFGDWRINKVCSNSSLRNATLQS